MSLLFYATAPFLSVGIYIIIFAFFVRQVTWNDGLLKLLATLVAVNLLQHYLTPYESFGNALNDTMHLVWDVIIESSDSRCDLYEGEKYLLHGNFAPFREWYHPDRLLGLPHNVPWLCPANNISLV